MGKEFNWGKSIFPIIGCKINKAGEIKSATFVGTGFFAVIGGYPIIISAKHVFEVFKSGELRPYLGTRYGKNKLLSLSGVISEHVNIDLGFMTLDSKTFDTNKNEFAPIPIIAKQLTLGTDVFTMGFPNSQVIVSDNIGELILEIDQFFFKGYVSNIIDGTERGGSQTTYLLNFPSMPGASGSPLLIGTADGVACVGYLFNHKRILREPDVKLVKVNGQEKEHYIYQDFNFGLACDSKAILEISTLLDNIKPKK